MWQHYVDANLTHPLPAAFVQFLVLGTIGEYVSKRIRGARGPIRPAELVLKALGWGLLGLYVKFMFVVSSAGTAALVHKGYLPGSVAPQAWRYAFFVSAVMNIFLGPAMMIVHRIWDNWVAQWLDRQPPTYEGLRGAMGTLLWMWIPLHTFTFTQPTELRIGIAALLSLLLGVVMGAFARRRAGRR